MAPRVAPGLPAFVALLLLLGATLPTAPVAEAANPTYRVFATREGLVGETTANGHVIQSRDHFAALPSRVALACHNCFDKQVKVCYAKTGRCETAPVWDVGPWNTKDNWWDPPAQREFFKDLPQGLPEAQAAFYDNYNGGKDQFGREVLNPAGIDLADGTFWDGLGMTGNDWIDVTFLWIQVAPFTVTITSPAAGVWLRGAVTARGISNQESGLHWMRFFVDGTLTRWVTPAPHEWSWDTRDWADGGHTLKLEGENGAGERDTHSIAVKLDNTPPTIAIRTPRTGHVYVHDVEDPGPGTLPVTVLAGKKKVVADSTDAASGVRRVEFRVDGGLRHTEFAAPYEFAWEAGKEKLGDHVLEARAFDVAGNSAARSLALKTLPIPLPEVP